MKSRELTWPEREKDWKVYLELLRAGRETA